MGRQRGIAVIIALAIAATVAVLSARLLVRSDATLTQAVTARDRGQAIALAQGGMDWARSILELDAATTSVDHRGEPWSTVIPPTAAEGGEIAGYIEEMNGKFDLGSLVVDGKADPAAVDDLRALLETLAMPSALADTLADRMIFETTGRAKLPANPMAVRETDPALLRPSGDVDCLADTPGLGAAALARLRTVTAMLPSASMLNLNTAAPEVLAARLRVGLGEARNIVRSRDQAYFRDLADAQTRIAALAPEAKVPATGVAVSSRFFLIHVDSRFGDERLQASAMVDRSAGRGGSQVVWQRFQ